MSKTVDIPENLKQTLRKFRMRRDACAALVVKIDKKSLCMVEDDTYEDLSMEDLALELPENAPRYVVLSYKMTYDDGRTNYPLLLINWSPTGSETSLLTLHASALIDFQNTADVQKVIEIREGPEGLTKEAIEVKLSSK